jgi:hypothetical protein
MILKYVDLKNMTSKVEIKKMFSFEKKIWLKKGSYFLKITA